MIIIVEGIDRVGKTTLANYIVKKHDYGFWKNEFRYMTRKEHFSNADVRVHELDVITSLIENGSIKNMVLDRFHISELVYDLMLRKNDSKIEQFMKDIDDRFSKLSNVALVHVLPSDISRSSKEHGSDLTDDLKWFSKLTLRSNIRCRNSVVYDDMFQVVDKLIDNQ